MACNCSTRDEIDRLYKQFGTKRELPDNAHFSDYVRYYVGNPLAYILMIITFPLLLVYVLALLFWREDGRIRLGDIDLLGKIRKEERNGRKQQDIQNKD